MIPKNPCGFIDNNCNGGPVRAEVSHLQNLKAAVQKKFLTAAISHLILFPITVIIKSAHSLESYFPLRLKITLHILR